jgi:hypothetical protein
MLNVLGGNRTPPIQAGPLPMQFLYLLASEESTLEVQLPDRW